MRDNHFDSLLPVATTYANQLAALFNLFLVVIFGSFVFAASVSSRKVVVNIGEMDVSISILMSIVLFSFYMISFISYLRLECNLRLVLLELQDQVKDWEIRESTRSVFISDGNKYFGLSLQSFGYAFGSIGSLAIFIAITSFGNIT
jgi:hypothetical protein